MKPYHIGLIRGTGKVQCWANGHARNTVVVQLRRSVDFLDTDLWEYWGQRVTTKEHYRTNKANILQLINKQFNTAFTHIVID
jgi:hypothetical protein